MGGQAQQMGGQGQQQRTMIADGLQSPTSGGAAGGTMMLPDSAGIIAFAQQQAEKARAQMADEQVVTVKPAGPLFWAAWVVLGVGIGLAAHFTIVLTSRPPTP